MVKKFMIIQVFSSPNIVVSISTMLSGTCFKLFNKIHKLQK